MHIVDGVLSSPVLIGSTVAAVAGLTVGLRQLSVERIPQTALLTAAFFVVSLVHVPIGLTNAHLGLLGLMGLLLGWSAFPAFLVGLILQAAFFGYGGLTTLGVNLLNLALPSVLVGLLFAPLLRRQSARFAPFIGFLAGALAIAGAAFMVSLSIGLSGQAFIPAAKIALLGHLPVMLVEGMVTASAVVLLRRVMPEVFTGDRFNTLVEAA